MTSRNKREGRYAGWHQGKHCRIKFDMLVENFVDRISLALSQETLSIPMGLSREEKRDAMMGMAYYSEILSRADSPVDEVWSFNSSMSNEEISVKFDDMVAYAKKYLA